MPSLHLAGVAGTLHRISAIRNRRGTVIGLTCRIGRAVSGHADMLRDLVESELVDRGVRGMGVLVAHHADKVRHLVDSELADRGVRGMRLLGARHADMLRNLVENEWVA